MIKAKWGGCSCAAEQTIPASLKTLGDNRVASPSCFLLVKELLKEYNFGWLWSLGPCGDELGSCNGAKDWYHYLCSEIWGSACREATWMNFILGREGPLCFQTPHGEWEAREHRVLRYGWGWLFPSWKSPLCNSHNMGLRRNMLV